MSCFSQEVVLELDVHQNSQGEEEDGGDGEVEEAEGEEHGLSVAHTKEAKGAQRVLAWVLGGSSSHDIHGDAHHQECHQPGIGHEEQIIVMVVDADTVVDPRAVMVEALHTHIAYGAVARPWSLDDLTVGAKLIRVEFLQQV